MLDSYCVDKVRAFKSGGSLNPRRRIITIAVYSKIMTSILNIEESKYLIYFFS